MARVACGRAENVEGIDDAGLKGDHRGLWMGHQLVGFVPLPEGEQRDEAGHEDAGVFEGGFGRGGIEDEVVIAQVLNPTEAASAVFRGDSWRAEV